MITRNKFHDNHDWMPLSHEANEANDVRVIILFEDASLLQELGLDFVTELLVASLDGNRLVCGSQHCTEYLAKLALER